jgi:AraC-like DNA-binding protein
MGTVSTRMCQFIVFGAAAQGVPPEQLLRDAALRSDQLTDPDGRVSRASEVQLWEGAVRLTGNDDFGLHLAKMVSASDLGGVGFAVRSSRTLGEAYERAARYLALVNQDIELQTLSVSGDVVALRHVPPTHLLPPRQAIECFMALLFLVGQRGIGADFVLRALHLRHPRPPRMDEHLRLFGVTPCFGAPHDELLFEHRLLDLPQREAEPALGSILDRHLHELLQQLPPRANFLDRVRAAVIGALQNGEPSLDELAQRLHMSRRSVQRRLQQEGTSIKDLTAVLRAELATRYLQEPNESVGEIAFLLGFSEPSTFHRAFKRWTGMTPAQYRQTRRRQPPG